MLQFRGFAGAEKTERVEVAFQVSPLAVGVEDALALWVGGIRGFDYGGSGAAIGSLGFRGHDLRVIGMQVPRIKDAGRDVRDSVSKTART
jgi:hypothetical protein